MEGKGKILFKGGYKGKSI